MAILTLLLLLMAFGWPGHPNAPDTTPDFKVNPPGVRLPTKCQLPRVEHRILSMIHAFNTGQGDAFAKNFTRRPSFEPYTADIGRTTPAYGLVTRPALAPFVRARYSAGDGWSLAELTAPQESAGLPAEAVFGLRFTVSYPGGSVAGGSKAVVSCSSGLVRRWVGPVYSRTPR